MISKHVITLPRLVYAELASSLDMMERISDGEGLVLWACTPEGNRKLVFTPDRTVADVEAVKENSRA